MNIAERQSNLDRQKEEVEALEAIYTEGEVVCTSRDPICLEVTLVGGVGRTLVVRFTLPEDYPSRSPPIHEVVPASWIPGSWEEDIGVGLGETWMEDMEGMYGAVEWLRGFIQSNCPVVEEGVEDDPGKVAAPSESPVAVEPAGEHHARGRLDEELGIVHGEGLQDRRSIFLAHLAPVHSSEEVSRALEHIVSERKVAKATHNIYAYRLTLPSGTILQDQEDDGETAAGGRLLHLMQVLDVRDVLVVASRWYGGIPLGPDRFKHINNVARDLLVQEGYVHAEKSASGKGKRGKSGK